jgi:hypothetical protein
MCLNTITHGSDPTEQGEGYKVFQQMANGGLRSAYCLVNAENENEFYQFYQTNTWMPDSKRYFLYADDNIPYQTGFHLFATEDDAKLLAKNRQKDSFEKREYVVRKVKYKGVSAKGTQTLFSFAARQNENKIIDAPTIVAKKIFIEEE